MQGNYTQTLVSQPTAPSTETVFDIKVQAPLIRERVAEGIVEEPKIATGLNVDSSFFRGQEMMHVSDLTRDLPLGQTLRVNIEKDQNPFSLFQKTAVTYDSVDDCHEQIEVPCTVPCINTLPTFEYVIFRYDSEYAYGVRACDRDKEFWDESFFTRQYAKSRAAEKFGIEVDVWNKVIDNLRATPATTVDAFTAQFHSTHFWANAGTLTANGRDEITEANHYMQTAWADINLTTFMSDYAAKELIATVETPYNYNFQTQRVNTFGQWELPGFSVSSKVQEILGMNNVVIMDRSPWMTYAGDGGALTTQYPLWNETGTKQFVAILDPRVGYVIRKDGYHLTIEPYDCDKLIRGMVDTEYVGSGITFPQLGLIIEFDQYTHPTQNNS